MRAALNVAAVTASRPRSLFAKASAAVSARQRSKPGHLTAVLAVAREHVVTFAALAAADFGAFHWGPGYGWLAVGGSLLAADFAVRG